MPRNTSGRLALAVSSVSLVVAMGGVTYAAATIGTAQLKNNAVTSAKIKNNNVTGQDVKESSLSQVPSAGTAVNAGAVDGMSIAKVNYTSSSPVPVALFTGGGLQISASCTGNDLALNATTSKQDSSIFASLVDLETDNTVLGEDLEGQSFDIGSTFDLLAGSSTSQEDPSLVTFAFNATDGTNVTGTLSTDTFPCSVHGTITFG